MSKAFKCDRCKICFDPMEMASAANGDYFTTIHGYSYQSRDEFEKNTSWHKCKEDQHLCPKCSVEFSLFMREKRPYKVERGFSDEITSPDNKDYDSDCYTPIPPGPFVYKGGERNFCSIERPDDLT